MEQRLVLRAAADQQSEPLAHRAVHSHPRQVSDTGGVCSQHLPSPLFFARVCERMEDGCVDSISGC